MKGLVIKLLEEVSDKSLPKLGEFIATVKNVNFGNKEARFNFALATNKVTVVITATENIAFYKSTTTDVYTQVNDTLTLNSSWFIDTDGTMQNLYMKLIDPTKDGILTFKNAENFTRFGEGNSWAPSSATLCRYEGGDAKGRYYDFCFDSDDLSIMPSLRTLGTATVLNVTDANHLRGRGWLGFLCKLMNKTGSSEVTIDFTDIPNNNPVSFRPQIGINQGFNVTFDLAKLVTVASPSLVNIEISDGIIPDGNTYTMRFTGNESGIYFRDAAISYVLLGSLRNKLPSNEIDNLLKYFANDKVTFSGNMIVMLYGDRTSASDEAVTKIKTKGLKTFTINRASPS